MTAAAGQTYDRVDCGRLATCESCARVLPCEWSMERQTCARPPDPTPAAAGLTVGCAADCPRFAAVGRAVDAGQNAYHVRVSNDRVGYLAYLDRVAGGVACSWDPDVRFPARVVRDNGGAGGEIVCDMRQRAAVDRHAPFVGYFRVTAGAANVSLRLDDEMDRYTAFYERGCDDARDERCVDCMWTDDQRR